MAWDFGNISEKFDIFCSDIDGVYCQDSLRYVGNQLVAVGTHVVEFWSEILQVKEVEVPDLSDSRMPAEGVDKEELSNASPLPKEEPDNELHSDSSLGQNVVSNEESCWDKAELSPVLSIEIMEFKSSVEGETSKPLDVNSQVSSYLQAIINSVVFDEFCESKFSDSGVSSDDLSTFSIDIHAPDMSSDFELCDGSVKSEGTECHSNSGKSDVSSTKEVTDQEDACAKAVVVEYATTERVMDHNVAELGTETDQSQLNKLEADESFILVDSNEICSRCDLEKIIPASAAKFDGEQNQAEEESNIPAFPSSECESEWVVV